MSLLFTSVHEWALIILELELLSMKLESILFAGKMESLALNLKTTEDLKIVLAQGSGPVHVTAYQACQSIEDFDEESMDGEEESMDEESPVKSLPKKGLDQKKSVKIPSDEEDESEDDEEEEVKPASPPAKKTKLEATALPNGKANAQKDKKAAPAEPQKAAPVKGVPEKRKLPEIEVDDDDDEEDDDDEDDEEEEM